MASKGPRSKLDHETRARRQKALEAPREPPRPKAHWDHVLEEMVWLSKDFESERKWKLAQAKKVALRASKNVLDQPTRGEKKLKEEELRLRKVALNISKDVKKFWMKIEKLVLYKYQLELEERKKKALDKQLDFLLGQTERYSTMLAENLVDVPYPSNPPVTPAMDQSCDLNKEINTSCLTRSEGNLAIQLDDLETDDDYKRESEDDLEDDERTIEEDEAQITDTERREELAALQAEAELPIEELLKGYTNNNDSRVGSPVSDEDLAKPLAEKHQIKGEISYVADSWSQVNGSKKATESPSNDVHLPAGSSTGLEIENSNSRNHSIHPHDGASNGNSCLDEELPVKKSEGDPPLNPHVRSDRENLPLNTVDEQDDKEYDDGDEEAKDDETTLFEEEEMEKRENMDPLDEIKLLQKESELPIEELLAMYRKDGCADDGPGESECASSSSDDQIDLKTQQDVQCGSVNFMDEEDGSLAQQKPTGPSEQESNIKEKELNHDEVVDGRESEDIIADAAASARSAQPTGNTFSTTKVRTKFPFLLKHPLREYQHIGLDWLVAMYEKRLNGILADEMGLGKTIMTIALLGHLACEKGIWGPHLIVVPTSVMLNWETEFLKWCPAFRILTYFGSAKERKNKRQGWLKPNSFHVCITTYRLVIQDSKVFKRKKWKYLILDEAHLIKNWKSQRWQTLLNFNSKRRILLTGTPLQNDLMELWSLMHFLMPHIFQSHQEFKDWFSNPISGMVEGQEKVNKEVVDRLHNVLRPFILRRLKRDVEKQLPQKHEHVIYCRLSRRQRNLYEDFIANSETQKTLASANFFGMISIIMQLRKVCNHPDLFEGRPIISSFDITGIDMQLSSLVCTILSPGPFSEVDLRGMNFIFTQNDFDLASWEVDEIAGLAASPNVTQDTYDGELSCSSKNDQKRKYYGANIFEEIQMALWEERIKQSRERAASIAWWNTLKCRKKPVFGKNLRELVTIKYPISHIHDQKNNPSCYMNYSSRLADIVLSPVERFQRMLDLVESFMFAIPASRAPPPVCWSSKASCPVFLGPSYTKTCMEVFGPLLSPIRTAIVRRQVYFPDRRLIQFDCGKLQELAVLLRRLKAEGHRALIFTQMTKMLDILEEFINLYGYTYMRLDGSTQPEERQTLMQRFNTNSKYFLFILSTRSGGVGINLVGADTVIFYDSDWNPAMDQQAQDRCHRIGQTREVHIYRLISESTIEENILKKANQKRILDDLVIQSGSYNTEFFKKLDPMDLFSGHETLHVEHLNKENPVAAECSSSGMELPLSNADVEAAIKQAEDEADYMALKKVEQEDAVDNQEFTEEVIGRLEDDEIVNEDDVKPEEIVKHEEKTTEEQSCMSFVNRGEEPSSSRGNMNEEKGLTLVGGDEEMDMLADVKQMAAAAAAAGQASSSFENQLRPIDRYAMRFLDLWYPIIDKSAMDYQVNVEEEEWELDRLEKFKEDLEAEIDEDQEPLLYERWDADFATTAYRQHVEALTQRQLMEELENEAREANDLEEENHDDVWTTSPVERRPKQKKKPKKTKFKSLKKGHLASELEVLHESTKDYMTVDNESPTHSSPRKKRKKSMAASEEENSSAKNLKKLKRPPKSNSVLHSVFSAKQLIESREVKTGDGADTLDFKLLNKDKIGGRISISYTPVKRVMMVKPEKLRKRGHAWSKDCSPDSWSVREDAALCAVVHEYGANWGLVSDALYDIPGGGFYRGRFRHPIHCCERFRELFFKYVLSSVDCSNPDKVSSSGSGKALLKVTEDQARTMLNVTSELPDNELLLQKHFVAILSSVWRAKCSFEHRQTMPYPRSDFHSYGLLSNSSGKNSSRLTKRMNLTNCRESSKLVMTALADAYRDKQKESGFLSSLLKSHTEVTEQVDVTVEFLREQAYYDNDFPAAISVSVHVMEELQQAREPVGRFLQADSSCRIAENRFRMASETCFEGDGSSWASSAFPTCDLTKYKSGSKSQSLGKHKSLSDSIRPPKSKVPRTAEPHEGLSVVSKALLQSPSRTPTGVTEYFNMHHAIFESVNGHSQFPPVSLPPQESAGLELIPYEYDPSFLAGLEELDSLVDFGDIG